MTAERRLICAIYTRKSTEEGLDQNFNSLDAQRDACENYIASQKSEGWLMARERYDDGGYSGGNMERPGLKKLLEDVRSGMVDIIVVYKIDRLSRSLADFAKLVEIFDEHKVTFVSVTQAFNTTTSMGRLTLNILLSFAQFERELAGERVRDKIAASRQRGIWMGGMPPLGYDVADRKLIPNPEEAKIVREMFTRFAAMPSMASLVRDLRAKGVTSKSWTTAKGIERQGKLITKGYVYKVFKNPVYIGMAAYKGQQYPGEHSAIIDQEVWDTVQELLKAGDKHVKGGAGMRETKAPSMLRGLIFSPEGRAFTPRHASLKR
ncbi:MAG: recombinase family protein [Betaproteobacteria bacterium]|nr:recombinase family protein [Betaproteobacteria bacterium]